MEFLNFIGGKWLKGASEKWANNVNPAQPKEILGKITLSTIEDVDLALQAATKAQPTWAAQPRPVRARVLEKAAQLMRAQAEELAKLMTQEEGKNLNEARGEVAKAINVIEFTASEGRRPVGSVIPSEMPGTMIYTTRVPRGVVALITPWNFPVCIPCWKIAPALLEGNTVIFKPASLTPATAALITRIFHEAGTPPGVLNLVYGSGSLIGNALVEDSRVRAISFTGSNEVGRELNEKAARRLVPVQLEMGGKNPLIVLDDADIEQAAQATVMGAFGSTGQRCTATSRAVVMRSVHEKFRARVLELTRNIRVGDGLKDPTAMGPCVDESQMTTVLHYIELGKKEGAQLLCGGERIQNEGYFVAPTIFDGVKADSRLAQEEIFGPVLSIIPVDTFEEAMEVANNVKFGLSSSLYTSDYRKVMRYAEHAETGILHVNSPTVGGEAQAPFGGLKATSLGGREMGSTGPEFYSEIKTIYLDYNQTTRKGNLY